MAAFVGLASSICGTILVVAGFMKLGQLRLFGEQIVTYQVIPRRLARYAGYLLPPTEIATGLALPVIPALAPVAILLFSSFAIAVGVNLARGRHELRCGCFGATGSHKISTGHIIGNCALAILAVVTFIARPSFSFQYFQLGVSSILLGALLYSWRTMSRSIRSSEGEPLKS